MRTNEDLELLEAINRLINFHLETRRKFRLAEGDVKNPAAAYYIEQMDVYLTGLYEAVARFNTAQKGGAQ